MEIAFSTLAAIITAFPPCASPLLRLTHEDGAVSISAHRV